MICKPGVFCFCDQEFFASFLLRHHQPIVILPTPPDFRSYTTRRPCTAMSEQETQRPGMGEQEPLLGRPGDASQQDGLPLYHNLIIGTILPHAGLERQQYLHGSYRYWSCRTGWILDPCCYCLGRGILQSCDSVLGASCKASWYIHTKAMLT